MKHDQDVDVPNGFKQKVRKGTSSLLEREVKSTGHKKKLFPDFFFQIIPNLTERNNGFSVKWILHISL